MSGNLNIRSMEGMRDWRDLFALGITDQHFMECGDNLTWLPSVQKWPLADICISLKFMPILVRRILVLGVGWGFILLGIVGLFLPILQGILFLLVGLAILSTESRFARGILVKLRRRFPNLARRLDAAEKRARGMFARFNRNKGPR
jgi:uncharacterized protein